MRHEISPRCAGAYAQLHGLLLLDAAAASGPGGLDRLRRAADAALGVSE